MGTVTVSEKGWVVIPKEIRNRYGLTKGKRVHIVDYGGTVYLIPASDDPIGEARGMLKGGPSLTAALLEDRREEREREEAKIQRWGQKPEPAK